MARAGGCPFLAGRAGFAAQHASSSASVPGWCHRSRGCAGCRVLGDRRLARRCRLVFVGGWRACGLKVAGWHRVRCWMQIQSELIFKRGIRAAKMALIPLKVRHPGADNFSTGSCARCFESVMKIGQTAENLVSKQVGTAANGPKVTPSASAVAAPGAPGCWSGGDHARTWPAVWRRPQGPSHLAISTPKKVAAVKSAIEDGSFDQSGNT